MFRDVDADVYLMVDGDDTYDANDVAALITPVIEGRADMVIGDRLSSTYFTENKRPFHNAGNRLRGRGLKQAQRQHTLNFRLAKPRFQIHKNVRVH
jgi:hypothetical protein